MKEIVPPIKSQGIKTKLVTWINDLIKSSDISTDANWIEPFFGTGVVGFNSHLNGKFIVGDTNPHIINFYKQIQEGNITSSSMREYLQRESELLLNADEDGYSHYRLVRDRFNINHDPYDFIFLSRAGFNGMMRFNGRGEWNIPFCKKPNRFASAYITKICNQINGVANVIQKKDWTFINSDFEEIINQAKEGDLIYCDPPYYGRYVDYFNSWTEQDEERLFIALSNTKAKFILSTWHHNEFRSNDMIEKYWNKFNIITREHFYHGGGKIENRHAMVEALVFNFDYKIKYRRIASY
jgi:DNA adenine methylase